MKYISILFLILLSIALKAQLSVTGIPESFSFTKKSTEKIPEADLGTLDINALLKADSAEGIPNRFAQINYTDIDIKRDGLKSLTNKGTIWRYTLSSVNALSIGIAFSQYYVPQGATLFIYSPDHAQILGAFTSLNNKENHYLKIEDLFSNTAIIEYFEPDTAAFEGLLAISEVSLAYRNLFSGQQINTDINCPEWEILQDVKHAICRMTYVSGQYSYFCTGSLINNTRFDETPFFLTATHCISRSQEAASLVTYFNYEAISCNGAAHSRNQTLSGAQLNSFLRETDYTLLTLNEKPPRSYEPYFLGWDVSGRVIAGVYGIHHPKGTLKKAAFSRNNIRTVTSPISWDTGPDSPSDSHWRVSYTTGGTETGSSGSPLLSNELLVIGQLHGGSETENYYGKLAVSWNYGTDASKMLKTWLDPDNTGTRSIKGIYGYSTPIAGFMVYPDRACTNAPVQLTDTSLYTPDEWKWTIDATEAEYEFTNGTSDSFQNPQIIFKNPGTYQVKLRASNQLGASEKILMYEVADELKLSISGVPEQEVCGYQLGEHIIQVTGASEYSFELSDTGKIESIIKNNSIVLNLKNEASSVSSYTQKVIVHGIHGSCTVTDSISFLVKIPAYDMIKDALAISQGQSGPFSNECASVEAREPNPGDGGCLTENTWCYDASNPDVINNSLWFKFTGPDNGIINISTRGFDTRIAVYKGATPEDVFNKKYSIIAANDNAAASTLEASLANLQVEPGTTYWLQVDAYKGQTGNLYLNLYNNELLVYPNPSSGIFQLQLARNSAAQGTLEIFNAQGLLVYKTTILNSPESIVKTVDLRTRSAGLYTAVIQLNDNRYIQKLVIIK